MTKPTTAWGLINRQTKQVPLRHLYATREQARTAARAARNGATTSKTYSGPVKVMIRPVEGRAGTYAIMNGDKVNPRRVFGSKKQATKVKAKLGETGRISGVAVRKGK